jgi:FkbM family methyltransferase
VNGKLAELVRATGLVSAANILARRKLGFARPIMVRPRCEKEQVWVRPCDSDLFVASQIFGTREYDLGADVTRRLNLVSTSWLEEGEQPVIIDGGANVGYSSIFFSSTYPTAKIIALEVDPRTYTMLEANVSHHPNIRTRLAALWSHDRGVDLHSGSRQSWSNFVSDREPSSGKALTPSVRLDQLVGTNERVLLIKLDIEGSERDACSTSREVLRSSPVILIEPHDFMLPGKACLAPLLSALEGQDRDILISGENLVFLDQAVIAAAIKKIRRADRFPEPIQHLSRRSD